MRAFDCRSGLALVGVLAMLVGVIGPGHDAARAASWDVETVETTASDALAAGPDGSPPGLALSVVPGVRPDPMGPPDPTAGVPPTAIPGQRFVWLVSVADTGSPAGPAALAVSGDGVAAIEAPASLQPGAVGEVVVTVPPDEPVEGATATLTFTVTCDDQEAIQIRSLAIVPGEDLLEPESTAIRDTFVTWLAETHPDLDINATTTWERLPAGAQILVVEHELFFSDDWEMGVSWHVMIPPYDWSEIYLRHRDTELVPSFAARIESRTGGDPPLEVTPPETVRR